MKRYSPFFRNQAIVFGGQRPPLPLEILEQPIIDGLLQFPFGEAFPSRHGKVWRVVCTARSPTSRAKS